MAVVNSSLSREMISDTPVFLDTANPHKTGRPPMKTAFAPMAKALRMSVPRRIPPSHRTPALPSTAAMISGRASKDAITPSNCLPP